MSGKQARGYSSTPAEIADAKRIAALPTEMQKLHPSAVPADQSQLAHVNTYGFLPGFYIDIPFVCRDCGKEEVWKAKSQKWYFEVHKAHVDSRPVRCYDCRKLRRDGLR